MSLNSTTNKYVTIKYFYPFKSKATIIPETLITNLRTDKNKLLCVIYHNVLQHLMTLWELWQSVRDYLGVHTNARMHPEL